MTEPLLRVEGLTKHFPITRGVFSRTAGQVRAVDGVSFDVAPGETLGLVGESGSGKTTVGRCILRLTAPTSGRILFGGRDVVTMPKTELLSLRRELQVVFQDPYSSLNPRLRVLDIVGEALSVHGIATGADVERRVSELLERVGLSPSWIHRYPHEFSGGQRQRVGIARAIALRPKLIVCDEAVSALDVSIQAQVINLLVELRREMNMAYLFIAHDLSVVRHVSHRIAAMYLGRLVEVAPSPRLFATPAHPYTRALLSAIPVADPEHRHRRLVLAGEIPSPANPPSGCHFHTRCPAVRPECRREDPKAMEVEPGHTVRCVHARDLPAGGDWFSELSRRIERATVENAAEREQTPEIAPRASEPEGIEWLDAWKARATSHAADRAESAALRRGRRRDAGVGIGVLGAILVCVGHALVGVALAVSAYLAAVRRDVRRRYVADAAVAATLLASLLVGRAVVEHGRRTRAEALVRSLSRQIEERAKLTGALPGRLTDLGWRLYPLFEDGIPNDPWGRAFFYRAPGTDGRRFDLGSTGPDGVPSADDIGQVATGAPPNSK
ncbi:MAG TPA: oligopeptide/dipeptide ABC transporter ATP-binding protein [Polyangiaceae bacterium]|nr:oligopeptide/dipeptide ABC transporter ATP-binding protein [Polyangiaceae bacterium]